jgi:hypothetical protein
MFKSTKNIEELYCHLRYILILYFVFLAAMAISFCWSMPAVIRSLQVKHSGMACTILGTGEASRLIGAGI